MPLQRIGNRSVYVLTPPDPEVAKTSTGVSWAQYYTSLRWKTWAAVKEQEATRRDLQAAAFKAGLDIYEQQRRDLNRAIIDMRELKAKTLAGGNTAAQIARAERDRLRELRLITQKIADLTQTQTTTTVRSQDFAGLVVYKLPDGSVTLDLPGMLDQFPSGTQIVPNTTVSTRDRNVRDDLIEDLEDYKSQLESQGPSATERSGSGAAPATPEERERAIDFLDQEIIRLEEELSGLRAPTLAFEDDLSATRRAYEQQIGVIGRGGGPFGLAPRPTRTSPRFDEMELAGDIRALENQYIASALQALPAGAPIEDEALAIQEARQRAAADLMQTPEFREVPAGEFLRRREAAPVAPSAAAPMDIPATTPVTPTAVPGGPRPVDGLFPRDGRTLEEIRAIFPDFQPETAPEVDEAPPRILPPDTAPVTPSVTTPVDTQVSRGGGVAVAPGGAGGQMGAVPLTGDMQMTPAAPAETPGAVIQRTESVVPDEEDARSAASDIEKDFADFQKDVIPQELIDKAREFYRDTTIQVDGGELRPIMETFETDKDMVGSYLLDLVRRDTPVQQYLPEGIEQQIEDELQEFRAVPRAERRERRRQTRAQKNASYFLSIMEKGAKLAEQPKKLERIAKSDLPDEERPEVVRIVEDLLQVSKGRANYFKEVFDEVSRYFRSDPDKMRQAHEYLAAIELLEGDVQGGR